MGKDKLNSVFIQKKIIKHRKIFLYILSLFITIQCQNIHGYNSYYAQYLDSKNIEWNINLLKSFNYIQDTPYIFLSDNKNNKQIIICKNKQDAKINMLNYRNDIGTQIGLQSIWNERFILGIEYNKKRNLTYQNHNYDKQLFIKNISDYIPLNGISITKKINATTDIFSTVFGINHNITNKIRTQLKVSPGIVFIKNDYSNNKITNFISIGSNIDWQIKDKIYLTLDYSISRTGQQKYKLQNMISTKKDTLFDHLTNFIDTQILEDKRLNDYKIESMKIDHSDIATHMKNNDKYFILNKEHGITIENIYYKKSPVQITLDVPIQSIVFYLNNNPAEKLSLDFPEPNKIGIIPNAGRITNGIMTLYDNPYITKYIDDGTEFGKREILYNLNAKLKENGISKEQTNILIKLKSTDNPEHFPHHPFLCKQSLSNPYKFSFINERAKDIIINNEEVIIPAIFTHSISLGIKIII